MVKFLFLGRRAAGRTRAAALTHLRDVHGRMVVCPPADAGAMPSYYAQNHVIDGAYPAGDGPHAIERDLVTQLEFESMAAMQAAVATPYYRANLRPDEPRFVDDATVARLNVVPRTVVAGPRTVHKLFVFVARGGQADDVAWAATVDGMAATIAGWDGVVSLIDNTVLPPPAGAPFVDRVFEAWCDDGDIARSLAVPAVALFHAPAIDPGRSLAIVAEEYTEDRLRSLLRCTAHDLSAETA